VAPPGSLGHLTGALRFGLGRRPRKDWRSLHVRIGPSLLGHLEGDPHEVSQLLALCGTACMCFDALKERPGLVGTERDFLEASEQFEPLKHGALH
jgi:hypothetical protein